MYKPFDTIEELYEYIEIDKNWTGAESSLRNRYPLRFVMFENFRDFHAFIQECQNHHVFVQSMEQWMSDGNDDQLMTYSRLASEFEEYVKHVPINDFVIAPFSEISRFYEDKKYGEFYSLVKTIRLINASDLAQQVHQRIYVPIIGMQSKMYKFKDDPNIHIWELCTKSDEKRYRLVLANSAWVDAGKLPLGYTLCRNMREWIALWKIGNKVQKNIVCTSKTLIANAENAQPDNAFEYTTCLNVLDFLTKGLGANLENLKYREEDYPFWLQLYKESDMENFDIDSYVSQRFNTFTLNDENDFVQIWFEYVDDYSRWLLKTYYLLKFDDTTYLNRALLGCMSQSTPELFSVLATLIFDEPFNDQAIRQRSNMLKKANAHKTKITETAELKVKAKLKAIAADPERGYYYALKYMSPLTLSEKLLMIEWLGKGYIQRDSIKYLFPSLYQYTSTLNLNLDGDCQWVNEYFDEYRKSKLANVPSERLHVLLGEKNGSLSSFELWKNNFKTVKTVLHNREDIDVFYWIDGLGVDWLPYIAYLIDKHKVDGVYLNEMYIATAEIPTRTAENKKKLLEISANELKKIGDLDSYAHSQKSYPSYIVKELSIVEEAISSVLASYNGKKVAFVSDHGVSYMPQLAAGLDIGYINTDHAGRCGEWNKGTASQDNKYVIADDGITVSSLTHNSLGSKTSAGQGAHGGATPEEVLVPIIIVSSQKNASEYSATLLENEIKANDPVVNYKIKGISSIDQPIVEYNGANYALHKISNDIYESERLNIVGTTRKITLKINGFKKTDMLVIKTGVEEDDLFGGL